MEAKVDLILPLLEKPKPWIESFESVSRNIGMLGVRYFVYNDGGGDEGEDVIRIACRTTVGRFLGLGSSYRVYFTRAVNRMLEESLEESPPEFVAVVHPAAVIQSGYWLDTLLVPMVRDHKAAVIRSSLAGEISRSPWRLDQIESDRPKGDRALVAVFRKEVFQKIGYLPQGFDGVHGDEAFREWESKALEKGWNVWRDARIAGLSRQWQDSKVTREVHCQLDNRLAGGIEIVNC